jgi:hypothetical protein
MEQEWSGWTNRDELRVFSGNSTQYGGAAHCEPIDQSPTFVLFTNVTVAENTATGTIGGVSLQDATNGAKFRNCIFWDNSDSGGNGSDAQLGQHDTTSPPPADASYCCIMGGAYTTNHNIQQPCLLTPRLDHGSSDLSPVDKWGITARCRLHPTRRT